MSTPKILGSADLAAATATNVFGPLTSGAMYNVRIVNRGTVDATVQLGVSATTATLDNSKLLISDEVIPADGTLELTGLAISTEYLVCQSDVVSVNVIAYGVEI